MKRTLAVVLLISFAFLAVQTLEAGPPLDYSVKRAPSVFDPVFLGVSGGLVSLTVIDVHNTMTCYRAQACVEGNKRLVSIVANGDEIAAYSIGIAGDAAVLFFADRIRRDPSWISKIWWAPPLYLAVAHTRGAVKGHRLMDKKKNLALSVTVRF